jgi:hypothetical protein
VVQRLVVPTLVLEHESVAVGRDVARLEDLLDDVRHRKAHEDAAMPGKAEPPDLRHQQGAVDDLPWERFHQLDRREEPMDRLAAPPAFVVEGQRRALADDLLGLEGPIRELVQE